VIKIVMTSDRRGEGKTDVAVKLLMAFPDFLLCVRTPHAKDLVVKKYHLPHSQASRIVTPHTDLSGTSWKVMIDDTVNSV
jgi:hypothetical protein